MAEAPPQLLAGLMRLLVLLPPSDLAHALHAVSSPLIAQLQPLAAQLRAAAQVRGRGRVSVRVRVRVRVSVRVLTLYP